MVADSLEDYLVRHPRFVDEPADASPSPVLLTSSEPARVAKVARIFLPDALAFDRLPH